MIIITMDGMMVDGKLAMLYILVWRIKFYHLVIILYWINKTMIKSRKPIEKLMDAYALHALYF